MILEDMYYGKWRPSEQVKSTDPESQKVNQKISDLMEMLKNELPAVDFEQIEVMFDLLSESTSLHSAAAFIHGYRTGALTMIEVFSSEKE
ncbi:hypothetical protein MMB75_15865 [Paenibacillus sp. P2(2022)]|uniref:DUF6809 family protein n=1 Tax=Paenibacillus TaxID=44249 RepID=UPI0003135829|nr:MULTISPECIES: DUF6809 family protein [Paenibacillus]KJK32052.1 hypothetical protein TY89_05715 [Paenibacillus polymyxa]MDG0055158.1 hypothetical protein [Paenibacillus sp. P2(2022)]MDN4086431.1 hypothetical protein [Paenibacillus polymyxa]NMP09162.1 hypothetical protein [Paenibacillus polymyxa]PNQ84781.1 hypothetical protein C1T20_16945 [Paenibacillus polymyxa]